MAKQVANSGISSLDNPLDTSLGGKVVSSHKDPAEQIEQNLSRLRVGQKLELNTSWSITLLKDNLYKFEKLQNTDLSQEVSYIEGLHSLVSIEYENELSAGTIVRLKKDLIIRLPRSLSPDGNNSFSEVFSSGQDSLQAYQITGTGNYGNYAAFTARKNPEFDLKNDINRKNEDGFLIVSGTGRDVLVGLDGISENGDGHHATVCVSDSLSYSLGRDLELFDAFYQAGVYLEKKSNTETSKDYVLADRFTEGVCVAAAEIKDGVLKTAHLGDVKIYLFDVARSNISTTDHVSRYNKNVVIRSIAIRGGQFEVPWTDEEVEVPGDFEQKLEIGDLVVVCSDGYSQVLTQEKMLELLNDPQCKSEDGTYLPEKIIKVFTEAVHQLRVASDAKNDDLSIIVYLYTGHKNYNS